MYADAHIPNFPKPFIYLLPNANINNIFSEFISSHFRHHYYFFEQNLNVNEFFMGNSECECECLFFFFD